MIGSSVPKCWVKAGEFFTHGFIWLRDDNIIYLVDELEVDKAKAVY